MRNSRALLVTLFIFLMFAALIVKLFDIQIVKSEELQYFAKRQQTKLEKVRPERGLIYDRNQVLLVYNKNVVSFYLDTRMVSSKGKKLIEDKFSKAFGKSKEYYSNLMSVKGKTICLEKNAPGDKAIQLKGLKIAGLFYKDEPTRVYHYGSLASHILGFVNSDYEGVNGIAKSLNEDLEGVPGSRLVERDAIGDVITISEEQTKPAIPGYDIYLTISKKYQSILEEELRNGLKKYGGNSAVGIIMNPNNGQVLALANMNDYDPNNYWDYNDDQRRDRAVTDTYEPGSTFKSFTLAALLNEKLCKENELVYVENGRYRFKKVWITDTHKNTYLTVKGVLEESSNIGISKLVQRLNPDLFYKYLRGFGFGNYTTINLPGEVKGFLKKPNKWSEVSEAFMSFGYEISVTPIQLAAAYCSLVNGGILYKPLIVEKEVDHNGRVILQNEPVQIRRVISENTSSELRKLMVGVVEKGTGKNAQIDYMKIGGKTGTSQRIVDGSYSKKDYNSSFVGFFPADNPKIVCLILVNSPDVGRYGGLVAAPIFKNVAEKIIKSDLDDFMPPKNDLKQNNQEIKVMFTKNRVDDKKSVSNQGKSNLQKSNLMPDLTNHTLRDAMLKLNRLGIKAKIIGTGRVVAQSIDAGTAVKKGNIVVLNCKETQINGTAVY